MQQHFLAPGMGSLGQRDAVGRVRQHGDIQFLRQIDNGAPLLQVVADIVDDDDQAHSSGRVGRGLRLACLVEAGPGTRQACPGLLRGWQRSQR